MWIFDRKTLAFLAVNDAAIYQYGFSREEFLQLTIKDIRPADDVARLVSHVQENHLGHDVAGIWRHKRKDGTVFEVRIISHEIQWNGLPAKLVLALDISQQRRAELEWQKAVDAKKNLEDQLRQAQKLDSVGRLAGGIAHDFNNLLGVIIGYADFALLHLDSSDPQWQAFNEIRKAGGRAAELTRQLLAFSRRQVIEPKILDLNAVVEDLSRMLRRMIGEHIAFSLSLKEGLATVKADRGQMEQVIVNLAVNARDAMPRGGKLCIETREAELEGPTVADTAAGIEGEYVVLSVTDTGHGMDHETQQLIFEPFFTTKEQGKGTGLGLSVVYGIVQQHGGFIRVYSKIGQGSTFKIYLPKNEAKPSATELAAEQKSIGGSETILLVEDAEGLRKLISACLRSRGYTVLSAEDGTQAIHLAKRTSGPIHILLSDVVVPGVGGGELTTSIKSVHPETRVVYMSGYQDDEVSKHGILNPGVAFLQKPFSPEQLWGKIREVLREAN